MTDTPTERDDEGAWAKLRRRKVVQWGLAYAAAAWTLLQVIEYLGETYGWPRAIRQIATPALALGSLPVVVLAWYHGDRGEQKISRPELAILATLATAAGCTLWWYASHLDERAWVTDTGVPDTTPAVTADAASIAVLPFVDMSPGKDQEYFADGMSEELLNLLTQLPQLHVIARTSSFSTTSSAPSACPCWGGTWRPMPPPTASPSRSTRRGRASPRPCSTRRRG